MTKRARINRASETLSVAFALAESNSKDRTFRGMALMFGAPIDCYPPTLFKMGAFTKTLAEQSGRMKILWQHDQWDPIGRPVFKETADGLEVAGTLDAVPNGDRALLQIESGTLTDLSIGWDPIRWEMVKPEALSKYGARPDAMERYMAMGEPVRVVTEARLWEVSVVTFGAQRAAQLYAASPFRDLPLAEGAWDPAAAEARVKEWAAGSMERLARAYLAHNGAEGQLLIGDVQDGRLVTVPAALFTAARDVYEGRLDVAEETETYVREHLSVYYRRMGLQAPWDGEGKARALVEPVAALPDEVFAGRVLSAANKKLVEDAIACLSALMAVADPKEEEPEPKADEMPAPEQKESSDVGQVPADVVHRFDLCLKEMEVAAARLGLPTA